MEEEEEEDEVQSLLRSKVSEEKKQLVLKKLSYQRLCKLSQTNFPLSIKSFTFKQDFILIPKTSLKLKL